MRIVNCFVTVLIRNELFENGEEKTYMDTRYAYQNERMGLDEGMRSILCLKRH